MIMKGCPSIVPTPGLDQTDTCWTYHNRIMSTKLKSPNHRDYPLGRDTYSKRTTPHVVTGKIIFVFKENRKLEYYFKLAFDFNLAYDSISIKCISLAERQTSYVCEYAHRRNTIAVFFYLCGDTYIQVQRFSDAHNEYCILMTHYTGIFH